MSKKLKGLISRDLSSRFSGLEDAVLFDVGGLNAEDSLAFRRQLRDVGLTVNVVKNTLARRMFVDRGIAVPPEWFSGPTAIAYGGQDAIATSKSLDEWRKKNKKELKFRGGLLAGKPLESAAAEQLIRMPGVAEAKGMVVSLIASPLTGAVTVLNNILATLPNVLQAIADKKKEEGE
ncbi:MAG: 50S ribosomal protein L10 [Planctomycetota bacterium]